MNHNLAARYLKDTQGITDVMAVSSIHTVPSKTATVTGCFRN